MSDEAIVARIARELGVGRDVVDALADRLAPSDLQSLLLHVTRRRSRGKNPIDVLKEYERRAMLQPSSADARLLARLERAALEAAAPFEAIALSPVAPMGVNTVLGEIDQNSCLATVRGAEVMADPTTALALEHARRRRSGHAGDSRLCTCARMLRLQPFSGAGFSPHFQIFALVTAGRDRGSMTFDVASLREHLEVYVVLLDGLRREGFPIGAGRVRVSDTERDEARLARAESDVLVPLRAAHPDVAFEIDRTREQGRAYYAGLCLSLDAADASGTMLNLADGGFTGWAARLLSNEKERILVSGMGLERVAKCWRPEV